MRAETRHLDGEYGIGELRVAPLTPVIGARVRGLDLRSGLAGEQRNWLAQAVRRHAVVFMRAPRLSLEGLVGFGRALGTLQSYPRVPAPAGVRHAVHPEVRVFAYDETRRGREAFWHFDVLPSRRPARAAILRARAVPEVGGDTLFCDMRAVWASLPTSLQERLAPARAVYDLVFERRLARFRGASDAEAMKLSAEPLVELPLVVTRPDDGVKALAFNPALLVGIVGLPPDAWQAIAAELRGRIDRPEFQCRHRWRADDVALWDNQACLHYATSDYWPRRRVMERVTLIDELGRSFLERGAPAAGARVAG